MTDYLCNSTMRDQIGGQVEDCLRDMIADGHLPPGVDEMAFNVEKPKDPEHGDFASNAALVIGNACDMSPRRLGEELKESLEPRVREAEYLQAVEVAGPGFLNFHLSNRYLVDLLLSMRKSRQTYGNWKYGQGRKVLVEFVSANPTGPLVLVQARSAALGDVLCRLLSAAGYEAESEYYVNDAGRQVEKLGESMQCRVRELTGEGDGTVPEDGYPGEYVRDLAQEYLDERGSDGELREMGRFAIERLLRQHRELLSRYGVEFDRWYRESQIREQGGAVRVLDTLRQRGYSYEDEGALWLRATEFGDDKDRVLVKSDGSYTYLLPDLAYHRDKLERGFDWLIDILGPDHHGYVGRMRAGLHALGLDGNALTVLISQWVRLLQGGEEVSMSKRAGTFITMEELLDEVGVDAARFFFVMRSPSSPLDFDMDLAREQSSENPVYYAQYAHARICSVLREAGDECTEMLARADDPTVLESGLAHPSEFALIRRLGDFPQEVLWAAEGLEPQRVASYILDLASVFHVFYTECRILGEAPEVSAARLYLAECSRMVLARALQLLGVEAPVRM